MRDIVDEFYSTGGEPNLGGMDPQMAQCLKRAKSNSESGDRWVVWYSWSQGLYRATQFDEYIEQASLADFQIAGFEYGEQTF